MTQTSTNYVTIGIKSGQRVASANADSLNEAHANGRHWINRGVTDTYEIWANGHREA